MPRTCPCCSYAFLGEHCDNPACKANPTVSREHIARLEAREAQRREDEAERQRIAAIRRRFK